MIEATHRYSHTCSTFHNEVTGPDLSLFLKGHPELKKAIGTVKGGDHLRKYCERHAGLESHQVRVDPTPQYAKNSTLFI